MKFPRVHMTREQEVKLVRRWQRKKDQAARSQLAAAHQGLIRQLAWKYAQFKVGIDFEDFVAEAQLGLLEAIDRFDEKRGTRLSTLVAWWANAYIKCLSLDQSGPLKVATTETRRNAWWHFGRIKKELEAQGIAATPATMSERLGISETDAIVIWKSRTGTHPSMQQKTIRSNRSDDGELGDYVACSKPFPDELVAEAHHGAALRERINKGLKFLTARERQVIEQRWLTDEPRTLNDIGKDWGLSRERARQVQARAFEKMERTLGEFWRAA